MADPALQCQPVQLLMKVRFRASRLSAMGRVLPTDPIRSGRSRPAPQLTLAALSIATVVGGWRLEVGC
jgi:hypothetical protein